MAEQQLLEILKDENAALRERVRQLEAQLGLRWVAPMCLRLTGKEAAILGMLARRAGVVLKEELLSGIYAASVHDSEMPEMKIIDVFVCKLRKKLKPFEIEITTVWGQGWMMTLDNRERVERLRKMEKIT